MLICHGIPESHIHSFLQVFLFHFYEGYLERHGLHQFRLLSAAYFTTSHFYHPFYALHLGQFGFQCCIITAYCLFHFRWTTFRSRSSTPLPNSLGIPDSCESPLLAPLAPKRLEHPLPCLVGVLLIELFCSMHVSYLVVLLLCFSHYIDRLELTDYLSHTKFLKHEMTRAISL